jgi:hypothetical protein
MSEFLALHYESKYDFDLICVFSMLWQAIKGLHLVGSLIPKNIKFWEYIEINI